VRTRIALEGLSDVAAVHHRMDLYARADPGIEAPRLVGIEAVADDGEGLHRGERRQARAQRVEHEQKGRGQRVDEQEAE
jgi:hypothetical protein